jgi:hypothetical protein
MVLFGMPLRQTTGFVQSLLRLAGLDRVTPDFSTICRRQKTLNVSLPYRGSTGLLNLLIDSTGIKAEGEGEWNARKHGGSKRRAWRDIHIGIDEKTLEVQAVEVTGSYIIDAPLLPELLNQIPPDQDIGSVTAPSRACWHALPGSEQAPEPLPETTRSVRNDTRGALCGDAGVDATAEALSRPRCIV